MGGESLEWPASAKLLEDGRRFLLEIARDPRIVIAFHGDVDGLSAAVLVERAFRRLQQENVLMLPAGKGENVYSTGMRDRIGDSKATSLIVLDMGSRGEPILPRVPTLVIDHHQLEGVSPGAVVVSSYGHDPIAPTSLLTYILLRPLVDLVEQEWLAWLGVVADLGVNAPFPETKATLKKYGRRNITEAVSLLNAAKRSSTHDVRTALGVLEKASHPADIALDRVEGVERLVAYREEVNTEVSRCSRTAPRFADHVALIRFSSQAQVHPLVAARWARRLPDYIVIAANDGYIPERVSFSVRSTADIDLIRFLRNLRVSNVEGEFGYGHVRATGGSVAQEDFERILKAVGFQGSGSGLVRP